jgi:hypothetical protein
MKSLLFNTGQNIARHNINDSPGTLTANTQSAIAVY